MELLSRQHQMSPPKWGGGQGCWGLTAEGVLLPPLTAQEFKQREENSIRTQSFTRILPTMFKEPHSNP